LSAAVAAEGLAYPLALKIDSPDLPHKGDAGGVRLWIADDASLATAAVDLLDAVRAARPGARRRGLTVEEMVRRPGIEVVLGLHRDPQLGPAVMLGLGGVLTEALRARSWRLLPLRPDDADVLIDEVPGLAALLASRRTPGPYDRAALHAALLAFAAWANDLAGSLSSAEVNPLIVLPDGEGARAVDCLIVPRAVD
jgi:acetyltransferase